MAEEDELDAFRNYVHPAEVAAKLAVVCAPPNRRDRPRANDLPGRFDFWFDGGACQQDTGGSSTFRFANGDEIVDHGFCLGSPRLHLEIRFANGRHVDIVQKSSSETHGGAA